MAYIIIYQGSLCDNSFFEENKFSNVRYMTIGGGSDPMSRWILLGEFNRDSDVNLNIKNEVLS